jgi:hypothetical protein
MRRLILLLSGGWLPPSWRPSGACLALGSSVLYQPPNAAEDDTTPGLRLCRGTLAHLSELNSAQGCVTSRGVRGLHSEGPLLGHGPQEARPFAGHGDRHPMGLLAACDEASGALPEPHRRLPTAVLEDFGLCGEAQWPMSAALGGITIRPGAFDQDAAGMGVACLGERSLAAWLTGGRFRGHEPQKRHQCPWAFTAGQVPHCCPQGDSHCPWHAT